MLQLMRRRIRKSFGRRYLQEYSMEWKQMASVKGSWRRWPRKLLTCSEHVITTMTPIASLLVALKGRTLTPSIKCWSEGCMAFRRAVCKRPRLKARNKQIFKAYVHEEGDEPMWLTKKEEEQSCSRGCKAPNQRCEERWEAQHQIQRASWNVDTNRMSLWMHNGRRL